MPILRTPELPATYEWHRGTPQASTEACTVLSLDTVREQAFVEWQPRTLTADQGAGMFPRPLAGGTVVVRPSGWVPLDRLTFTGTTVVEVLAAADRAAQAPARPALALVR